MTWPGTVLGVGTGIGVAMGAAVLGAPAWATFIIGFGVTYAVLESMA